ncbi:hypothetical protein [Lysobacter sp. GCM10012299]|uniref:hypothetical protein n=1 Tax=Lysobacter sp. GCM10012299 TaxID=3317333 RepID=UPI003622C94B
MEPKALIDSVITELDRFKGTGNHQISVEAMKRYMEGMKASATTSLEERRIAHEGSLAQYSATTQYNLEMFKSVMDAGRNAIQALLIINGGAVIAMLGMLSNLAGKPTGDVLARLLALPLLQFGIGVLLAASCYAVRYFSQACYAEAPEEGGIWFKAGQALTLAAILVGISGYVLFAFGIANSYTAVRIAFGS